MESEVQMMVNISKPNEFHLLPVGNKETQVKFYEPLRELYELLGSWQYNFKPMVK